jgi:pimeloyl-ACP methyl ester carboxylesterase
VFVVDALASIYLRFYSFDFHRTSLLQFLAVFPTRLLNLFNTYRSPARTLTYWYRPHTSRTRLPVLFIHGIGVGLYMYVPFLADLNAEDSKDSSDGQVGIIAIEIMPISSRITAEAMLKDEMCEEIHCILTAHGWERFILVSHS